MFKNIKMKIACIKLGYYNGAWATSVRLATIYHSVGKHKESGYWIDKCTYYRDKAYMQQKRTEIFLRKAEE